MTMIDRETERQKQEKNTKINITRDREKKDR